MPKWLVPFDSSGNQLHYPEDEYEYKNSVSKRTPCTMLENFEFDDTLTYVGFQRGRSAAYFIWERANSKKVTMFLKDLDESIKHIVNGKLSGTFTFCKRGANFGVKILKVSTKSDT